MTDHSTAHSSEEVQMPPQYRVGFFVADSGGLCYWASSELLEMANLHSDDLLGQFWFRILGEKDRKRAITEWEASIPALIPFSFTGSTDRSSAKESRLLVECEIVPEQKNRPSYCVGVVIQALAGASTQSRDDRLREALARVDKAERDRFELTASLNVADSTVNQLQSDLKRATDKNQALSKRIDELGKNVSRTEEELAQTCSAKFGLESQIAELKTSHSRIVEDQQKNLVSARNELEAKLVEKTNELRPLYEERSKLSQEREQAQKRIQEQEAQIVSLTERSKALEQTLEREKTKAATILQEKVQEHTRTKAELDAQLLKMLGEASDLLNTKKQLSDQILSLTRSLEKEEENEKELLGRIQTLELGLSTEKSTARSQSEMIELGKAIQDELTAEKRKNAELDSRVNELGEKLAAATVEIQDGKNAIKAISRQSDDIDELKARYEKEKTEAQQRSDAVAQELKVLGERLERDTAELNLHKRLNIDSKKALQAPTKAISHLGKHLSTLFLDLFGFLHHLALSGQDARSVAQLKTSADYIAKLAATVVDALNLEHRQEKLAHEKISLKRFVAQLTGVFEFKASQQDISFSSEISHAIPESVYGDPLRLEHALFTLLGNILKLLPEDSSIALNIDLQKKQDDLCHLHFIILCSGVSDIRSQEICALAASTTAFASQSSDGLGFAMCRKILDLMGSRLDISDEENSFRMHFALPLSLNERPPVVETSEAVIENVHEIVALPEIKPPPVTVPIPPLPGKTAQSVLPPPIVAENVRKLRILLAEDNRINQNFITRILNRQSHTVTLAVNGKEAFEKAQSENYDLILMDCQMPQMDGYQSTRHIRTYQEARGLRSIIVGMSAHLDLDGRERCLNVGMDEYVSKPIQETQLVELIGRLFP